MPALSERTNLFTDSPIAKMSVLSEQYGAVNLSAGFPDFPSPRPILDSLKQIADEGPHQYSLDAGSENFRHALAEFRFKCTGRKPDTNKELIATCGGTEALISTIMTVVDKGDKVIIFSPYYDAYSVDVKLAGGEPIFVSLRGDDFTFNEDEMEKAFKERPKAVLLCDPSNPCGKVFTREELGIIAAYAEKYDTFVIVDEVYSQIIYKPYTYTYFSELPHMHDRTICVGSLSKTYSITGWRVGYILGPEAVIDEIKKVHTFFTISAPSPLQEAAVTGLRFGGDYYDGLVKTYTEKRDILMKGLDDLGLKHNIPQGAFYLLVDISEFGYEKDTEFCEDLVRKVGVGSVPGSTFFAEDVQKYVRLHFAVNNETLYAALNRLESIRSKLSR